jgi:late competence protein required for DNA uptake (superfamily II DNA/RNA helicase)
MSKKIICPRCESEHTAILTQSPVPGVWEVYHCEECLFAWRSTEPDFITDPARYNPEFKLTREQLDHAGIMPAVPPLLKR